MSSKKMGNIRPAILQAAHLHLPEAVDAGEESRRMVIEAALCTEYDLAELLPGKSPMTICMNKELSVRGRDDWS